LRGEYHARHYAREFAMNKPTPRGVPGGRGMFDPGFVENFTLYEWLNAMRHSAHKRVTGGDAAVGLRKLKPCDPIPCEGGYCKRHHFKHPAKYETSSGFLFCDSCAKIWATKVEIGCRGRWPN
jgi:hypothetical protein